MRSRGLEYKYPKQAVNSPRGRLPNEYFKIWISLPTRSPFVRLSHSGQMRAKA